MRRKLDSTAIGFDHAERLLVSKSTKSDPRVVGSGRGAVVNYRNTQTCLQALGNSVGGAA
jgi:hypothetical protein